MSLTHIDDNGAARMVDVGEKEVTRRSASAQAVVSMQPETLSLILSGGMSKGDVFACARIAGIMAAKRTWELIPMCHPLPIEGIEMEALTAASVAALTLYDMCKAVDRGMVIRDVMLLRKSGGKSGDFCREV